MTSNDGSLTRVVLHSSYKEKTYLANIILNNFEREQSRLQIANFFRILYGYGVMISHFRTTVGTRNNVCHSLINDCFDFHMVDKL